MPKVGMEPIRRSEVINAALECICEKGIEGITLDMVAAKAGFSKGVVAYYFKTKNQLILECFRAFLSYYQVKIKNDCTENMNAEQMLLMVVAHGLPPVDEKFQGNNSSINVSDLDGTDKMYIPVEKKARLFIQFFSKAGTDIEFQEIIKDIYTKDLEGISSIVRLGILNHDLKKVDARKAAYGLLAMIVGLSFFRVADFHLPGGLDNRVICLEYVNRLLLDKEK